MFISTGLNCSWPWLENHFIAWAVVNRDLLLFKVPRISGCDSSARDGTSIVTHSLKGSGKAAGNQVKIMEGLERRELWREIPSTHDIGRACCSHETTAAVVTSTRPSQLKIPTWGDWGSQGSTPRGHADSS